jgi:CheY-like chemotaxis protein
MDTNTFPPLDGKISHQEAADSRGKHTVLYIEDSSTNRQLVRYILDLRPDLTLLEAEDGTQGLEIARRHKPDLILLDIHLPDMDGFAVFKHLQNDPDTAHIPVVALSGSAAPADIERGMTVGFKKFLSKPIDIKLLFTTLDTILRVEC